MYKRILVGYDGSEHSTAAIMEIAAIMQQHGGRAELLHVVYCDEEEFGVDSEFFLRRVDRGKGVCERARRMAADLGIAMRSTVRGGDPSTAIVNRALENNSDLVVLGTYGRRGIRRLIMGSVTAKVILDAPCDVMIVKYPRVGFDGRYNSILVPYDGSPAGQQALGTACQLALIDEASLTVLYVIPCYEEMMGFFNTENIKNILLSEAQGILDDACKLAKGLGVSVETVIENGHAAEKSVAVAVRRKTELIVMGSHGWRGMNKSIMGSVAEEVIALTTCPVLVTGSRYAVKTALGVAMEKAFETMDCRVLGTA